MKTIVVIDDEPDVLEILNRFLSDISSLYSVFQWSIKEDDQFAETSGCRSC